MTTYKNHLLSIKEKQSQLKNTAMKNNNNNLSPEFQSWLKAEQAAANRHRNKIIAIVSIVVLIVLGTFLRGAIGGGQDVQPANTKQAIEKTF